MQAMVALQGPRPKRGLILAWMATCNGADFAMTTAEVCGCLRWLTSLKPGCAKVQLPAAKKAIEWAIRTTIFFLMIFIVFVIT